MGNKLKRRIRFYIIFFIVAILASGITTFPIESELKFFTDHPNLIPSFLNGWFIQVYEAVKDTNATYPFLAYGTDWLAWAHLIIALLLIGPLKDPVKNIWVIEWAMIACIFVFPLALIAGHIRHVPMYWRLVDCSLGLLGLIPLILCHRAIRKLEKISAST